MKVKEVIAELSKYDENLDVCGTGHFGEPLELRSIEIDEQKGVCHINRQTGEYIPAPPFVSLSIEYAGDSPD